MGSRLELHDKLISILGTNNVYFQPPESVKLKYPCIVYKCTSMDQRYANDKTYLLKNEYQVTVIDKNPDTILPLKIAQLPLCRAERFFISDNLNHYPFTIYY